MPKVIAPLLVLAALGLVACDDPPKEERQGAEAASEAAVAGARRAGEEQVHAEAASEAVVAGARRGAEEQRAEAADPQAPRALPPPPSGAAPTQQAPPPPVAPAPPVPNPAAAPPQPPPAPPLPGAAAARSVTTTAAHPVNIRSHPRGGGTVVRTVPRASVLRVFGEAPGGWFQVGGDRPFGWVHGSVLKQ
jgi:Bacterial SH3 domain